MLAEFYKANQKVILSRPAAPAAPAPVPTAARASQRGGGNKKLIEKFINISTGDQEMKTNLLKIANVPSDKYKNLIRYVPVDPMPRSLLSRL